MADLTTASELKRRMQRRVTGIVACAALALLLGLPRAAEYQSAEQPMLNWKMRTAIRSAAYIHRLYSYHISLQGRGAETTRQ
jgi:hypothetical protein